MIKAKKIYKKMVIGKLKRHNEIGTFDCILKVLVVSSTVWSKSLRPLNVIFSVINVKKIQIT